MYLDKLIEPLAEKRVLGSGNPDIQGIAYDSRQVVPDSVFVCIRGGRFDGHEFIEEALSKGASVILTDDPDMASLKAPNTLLVSVPDTRVALPVIAAEFYGHPSRRLILAGVTGTKGKTTTTYLMESIFRSAGHKTGVIGTLGVKIGDESSKVNNTTPESLDLQSTFSRMLERGVTAAVMEVSSIALVKGRTDECEFDVGIFTNLTQDHLDFHNTLDEYFKAKLLFFQELPARSTKNFIGVINADDALADEVIRVTHGETITFGIQNKADIVAENIVMGSTGSEFDVRGCGQEFHVSLKLGGIFNVSNALAAIGCALALGLSVDSIVSGLEAVSLVPGRFVQVQCGQDFGVVIDYAHSPDSLANILKAARDLTKNRLIVVFGCGGDRDRGKRPIMGRIGAELADISIITSDNPRTEDPASIIKDILAGIDLEKADVESLIDRREAILRALETAETGDVVVIAGKGHENYQIFKDCTIHFDDREVVEEGLQKLERISG
ncbi:MAG TPA: UDP-N-acetylmuramoyl-L-alanyl-D-glutamate--2,6-diaminopimelate ligase [Armatimonadota bacterium]